MKLLLLLLSPLLLNPAFSQRVIDVGRDNVNITGTFYSVGGWAVSTPKYMKTIEGSPYFDAAWMKARLLVNDSVELINILIRLELLSNSIEYIGAKKEEMVASAAPIKEITLVDSITGKNTRLVQSSAIKAKENKLSGWFQVLVSEKTNLYKHIIKESDESKPYGSGTTEQRIKTFFHYYILHDGRLVRIKKIREIPELLKDKKKELISIIEKNNLSGKSDADYIGIVFHYNQLLGQN